MSDDFGDRMKAYEMEEAGRRLMARLPIVVRIDGKRFSRFTEGLARPYDERLSKLMVATTRHLMEEGAALAGYTQSDEISLIFYNDDPKVQIFLDRRVQKLTSILASIATGYFNAHLAQAISEKAGQVALFDCRVWAVPSREEATNALFWREIDATKNSISMAARSCYKHSEIVDKNSAEMQEMLFQKGINWNDYPAFFKRGTYLLRQTIERPFRTDELDGLPPKHAARSNPNLIVSRTEIRAADLPPMGRVQNRVGVLFDGESPRMIVQPSEESRLVAL